jgi:methylase of polypeptide subunit release factors
VFLRICEDRGLESYEDLKGTAIGRGVYDRLLALFYRADSKYNSGLFHFNAEKDRGQPDLLTPTLRVDDSLLREIISALYYPTPFQFSVIPPEILGEVYEQFLGKVITVDSKHKTKVLDKPEIARAGGVYYTPEYVVEHIVERAVARGLVGITVEELVMGGRRRKSFRVLDPACGSGSFLLVAYQCLLDWFLDGYVQDAERWSRGRNARLRQSPAGDWTLTMGERKRILLDHIFGVDIDRQAVEVTKLSLLLRVLEGESDQSLGQQFRLFHERALPDLDANIRSGNSLVAHDVYNDLQMALVGNETREQVNAFDWAAEFPQASADGGFDAVIGNPPYVYRNATEDMLRGYYERTYVTVEGNFDLYKFFLERGLSLVRDGGRLGYIVSASFLVQPTFSRVRRLLLSSGTLEHLAPMGPGVFVRAAVDACIVVVRRAAPPGDALIDVQAPATPTLLEQSPTYRIPQQRFESNPDQVFDYRLSEDAAPIVRRIFNDFPTIEAGYEFGVGINTGFIRADITSTRKVDKSWHPMVAGTGISRYGEVRTDGWIMYDPAYVRSRGTRGRSLPQERFFREPKILVVRTRNLSLARRIVATIDESKAYNLNRLSNIIARPGYSLKGLLGVLNSTLFDWLFSTRFFDYEIKPVYLRQCPMPNVNEPALISAVEEMLRAKQAVATARTAAAAERLLREVDAADRRIDVAVYGLFSISADESAIIETQMRAAFAIADEESSEDQIDDDAEGFE